MTDAIDTIIEGVISREGGYVERANDHGGATRYGVTLKALRAWRGDEQLDSEDVKALSAAEAHEILRREYVERPGISLVQDPLLRELLADTSVNAGPERAVEFLQVALGVKPDGAMGPITREALAGTVDQRALYLKVLVGRAEHYANIMQMDHSQREFASGWMRRVAEFIGKAA